MGLPIQDGDSMEHKIIGKAHIEATQRGFVIWVKTNKKNKAQLIDANENYDSVKSAANSIDQGRWVGRRPSKNAVFHVQGKTLTYTIN